jgi:hypothetical protein
MVDAAPDGELDPKIRAALVDPVFWIVSHLISGLALGVVFLMAVKPNGWQSLLVVAIAGLIGLALGRRGAQVSSQPSREPSAAA